MEGLENVREGGGERQEWEVGEDKEMGGGGREQTRREYEVKEGKDGERKKKLGEVGEKGRREGSSDENGTGMRNGMQKDRAKNAV